MGIPAPSSRDYTYSTSGAFSKRRGRDLSRARAGPRCEDEVMNITIQPLTVDHEDAAARLLARAFVTNPLHVAVFGKDQVAANEAFFRIGLASMKGQKLVAVDGSLTLGMIHWVHSPKCQFSAAEKLQRLPAMLKGFGLRSTIRIGNWLSVWSKHDPAEHHSHLGPIAVSPEAQGLGIGRQLMERYCDALGGMGTVGYLETDRPENVRFYERFGFEVTEESSISGVVNYFMRRDAKLRNGSADR
ncbi:MAG: GNAT family N-acetyltransferase [Vicinamibacteria bacterium]